MRELGLLIFILALSPVVILGLHCFLHRLSKSIGFHMSGQQGAILSVISANLLLLLVAWSYVLSHWRNDFLQLIASLAYLTLVYYSIGFGYFSFLNLSETSLHVHILLKILAKGKVRLQELKSEYNPETMVNPFCTSCDVKSSVTSFPYGVIFLVPTTAMILSELRRKCLWLARLPCGL